MPYIGNPPVTQFASLDYQDLTGVTGVPAKRGYTLNSAVGSANDIEVFVNNVRQEPGVAYTVSGTTLTMTGDVETTDDFYVVFQGKAVGTASHPAGNALEATSGTFTGNVSITGTTSSTGAITATAGIILPSGQGIDFSATSDGSGTMSSELFDDYEEGTFTPRLYGATTDPTAGKIDASSAVYAKIGQAVYFYAFWSNVDTSGASGTMTIDRLPFTQISSISQNIFPYISYTFDTSDKDWFFMFGAASLMTAYKMTAGSTSTWTTRNITAGTGKYLNVAGVYLAS